MIFLRNKYKKWYFGLINKAENRDLLVGELHHIIPKCLGGSNDEINIVKLTFREHFLAHWLLTKITSGNNNRKMYFALAMMKMRGKSSWMYELSRKAWTKANTGAKRSIETKIRMSNVQKGKIRSKESIEKVSIALKGRKRQFTTEWRKKIADSRRGKKISVNRVCLEETRKKISNTLKGRPRSVLSRQKQSLSWIRKRNSRLESK